MNKYRPGLIAYSFFIIALSFVIARPALASDAAPVVRALIQQGKIDEAEQRVAAYLDSDPNDIDALMMKGNVILSRFFGKGMVSVTANPDESVYDRAIGHMGEMPRIVSREVALKVAALWQRCLELDSSRGDIWRGLAYLYATALMKQELIAHLPRMKAALPHENRLAFNMGDYARMFNKRERFADSMDIYQAILQLYPDSAWIYNDMAVLTYQQRRFPEALALMNKAVNARAPTWQTYSTATTFFTLDENDALAIKMHQKLSKMRGDLRWRFYRGLVRLARGERGWRADIKAYLAKADSKDEDRALAVFLLSGENKLDYKSYERAVRASKLMQFDLLLNRWGMRIAPAHYEPLYANARLLNENNHFARSSELFGKLIAYGSLPAKWHDQVRLEHAWAYHASGRYKDAAHIWQQLEKSEDFFIQSAAIYFLGDYAAREGNEQAASAYFKRLYAKASKSKYATMAWNRINAMKK